MLQDIVRDHMQNSGLQNPPSIPLRWWQRDQLLISNKRRLKVNFDLKCKRKEYKEQQKIPKKLQWDSL